MNIFKTAPAVLAVASEIKKYNANVAKFEELRSEGKDEEERDFILKCTSEFADSLSKKLKVHYEVIGEENIPEKGPLMIYSNHQSFADILAIFAVFRKFQVGFVAKDEWRSWKSLARAIEYTRSIFLVRGGGRQALAALSEAEDYLARGFSLTIFPEGTRSQKSEVGEFKHGAFKFAQKGNVPILPISLDGGYKLFEIDHSYHKDVTIRVNVHPLVHIEEMSKAEQKEAFCRIEQSIRDGVEDLVSIDEKTRH